jgi:hypothetical protein
MKNIHVLPTDKPSRFVTSKENKKCYLYSIEEFNNIDKFIEYDSKSWDSQNIYITSDEEINQQTEPCWCINTIKNTWDADLIYYQGSMPQYHYVGFKKIILTTDQELIKDGVQAIDDEFLEWFVKNPSCDEIEFEKFHGINTSIAEVNTISGDGSLNWQGKSDLRDYKIIIPKEEPKGFIPDGNWNHEEEVQVSDYNKQETLLQIANRKLMSNDWLNGAEFGAKWQQEQDNKMYSEEEVLNFTQTMIMQYKFGNTNIEQMDLLKETLQLFKNK